MMWQWLLAWLRPWRTANDEIDAMADEWRVMDNLISRRIAELYTPEEWKEVEERCMRQLYEFGRIE